MSDIRAIFLDIDGTLIHGSGCVSAGNHEALKYAKAKGCHIILATGRGRFTSMGIAEKLSGIVDYLVFHNGASTMFLPDRRSLYCELLPAEKALSLVRLMVEVGLDPYVYADGISEGVEAARVLHLTHSPGVWAEPPRYRQDTLLLDRVPFDPISVCSFGMADKLRPTVPRLLESLPEGIELQQTGSIKNWGIELFAEGVDKTLGMKAVCSELWISLDEVMAVGDHMNDLGMLAAAGVGVAMGNSLQEVKSVAGYATGSVEVDGVAQAIYKYL